MDVISGEKICYKLVPDQWHTENDLSWWRLPHPTEHPGHQVLLGYLSTSQSEKRPRTEWAELSPGSFRQLYLVT